MLRLTDTEYDILCHGASTASLPLAEYARRLVMGKQVKMKYEIVADIPELQELTAEFGKIGSNLNQIAKYFHLGGARSKSIQDEIHDCISQLFDLRNEVRKLAGEYRGNIETYRK